MGCESFALKTVGGLLVGEIHPGHHAVEHAAREYRHVQVRRLDAAVGAGQRPGLERDDAVRAVRRGRAPAEAAEALVAARGGPARVVGMGEPPVRPGLPLASIIETFALPRGNQGHASPGLRK